MALKIKKRKLMRKRKSITLNRIKTKRCNKENRENFQLKK